MNFRSALSSIRKVWASAEVGNVLLLFVLLVGLAGLGATVYVGAQFNRTMADQTIVLREQVAAIQQQGSLQGQAINLLGELVAGQQSAGEQARALSADDLGGGQIKITSWKYRNTRTGACETMTIQTSQLQGESFADFQARHFLAVRTDQQLLPPDPSCP